MKLKKIIEISLLALLSGCSLRNIEDKGLEDYVNIYEKKIKEEERFYCDDYKDRNYVVYGKDEYGKAPALFKVRF